MVELEDSEAELILRVVARSTVTLSEAVEPLKIAQKIQDQLAANQKKEAEEE